MEKINLGIPNDPNSWLIENYINKELIPAIEELERKAVIHSIVLDKINSIEYRIAHMESQITDLYNLVDKKSPINEKVDKECDCWHEHKGGKMESCPKHGPMSYRLSPTPSESSLAEKEDRRYNCGFYDGKNEILEQLLEMKFRLAPNSGAGRLMKDILRELFGKE